MAEAADDLDVVIDAAALWLAAGRHVALATVIETWGSAPRRAGSHLVIRDDGIFEGSVSGGCVEGDVIVQALELIAAGERKRVVWGKSVSVRVNAGGRRT